MQFTYKKSTLKNNSLLNEPWINFTQIEVGANCYITRMTQIKLYGLRYSTIKD